MKERLSVMMLAARGTIYKMILLILVTGIVQAGLFYLWMANNIPAGAGWSVGLEGGITDSFLMPGGQLLQCGVFCFNIPQFIGNLMVIQPFLCFLTGGAFAVADKFQHIISSL